MSSIGIAASLYTVRERAAKDFKAALREVKQAGFNFVHWSGMPDLSAADARRALDNAGLRAVGAHCPVEWLEQNFEGAVEYWRTIGTPDIAAGGMAMENRVSLETWLDGCRRLDLLGRRLRERDIRLSYHNHAFELSTFPQDPRKKLELLIKSTNPDHVYLELDIGWLKAAGEHPADWLRQLAGRSPLVQLQDVLSTEPPTFTALGAGEVDWDALFDAGEEAAVEWYIYKQEQHAGNLSADLAASYSFLAERA